jgi:thiamine biosynthesis lipoprotein
MQRVIVPDAIDPAIPLARSLIRDYGGETMGTTWSVRLVDGSQVAPVDWQSSIQQQLDQLVTEMSHWDADSNLGRYNRAPAETWHELPAAFNIVLAYAVMVRFISNGAYDPTAGALVNLWGFGPHAQYGGPGFVIPDAAAIAQALKTCGCESLQFDQKDARIYQPGGLQLDLSAIAKGFAVDLVARYLEEAGVKHYLVEVGGELRGAGMKPDGQPWWVALELPADTKNIESSVVALHGLSIATSGDYRRFFEMNGQRYAHTIDPRSGLPVSNGIASVTVIHPECMAADALSTAITVLGVEEGVRFADEHDIAARLLVRNAGGYAEHLSRRFAEMMQ